MKKMNKRKKKYLLEFLQRNENKDIKISFDIDGKILSASLGAQQYSEMLKSFNINAIDEVVSTILDEFIMSELSDEEKMDFLCYTIENK